MAVADLAAALLLNPAALQLQQHLHCSCNVMHMHWGKSKHASIDLLHATAEPKHVWASIAADEVAADVSPSYLV